MEDIQERGIYTDLVRELAKKGNDVYVVFPRERRTGLSTEVKKEENIKLLKVRTGNITETSFFEKGISTLVIENQFLKAIKKYFPNVRFDLIIYSTPPITFEKVVHYLKKKHGCKTYLVLKDIFPQNAVDLNIVKEKSLLWMYFRNKEKRLYKVSDIIGCMSQGNVNYVLKYNSFIEKQRIEIFPNSIEPVERAVGTVQRKEFYEKYNIPTDATLFVYGGNLGKPQGIDFLIEVTKHFHHVENGYLLIIGSGTEYEKIRNHIEMCKPKNVTLFNKLPKHEFDELLEMADVGLIFLDRRFTIPNIPSRLTSYMEYSLPVLAATDKHTDLKEILIDSNCGLWSESGNVKAFIENAKMLSGNKSLRDQMGIDGRNYLEEHYDIRKTVHIITKHLQKI